MFNIGGPCDDIAHAGQAAPLPMVVCSLVFSRDRRRRHLTQQESSDKNEASGTHAESPSPRLPAIQTLHNRGEGAGPPPGRSRPSTTGRRQPRAAESKKRGRVCVKSPALIEAIWLANTVNCGPVIYVP